MREYVLTNEIEYGEQIKNASGMITAMASDYRSVYYVDLDKDEGICYRSLCRKVCGGGVSRGGSPDDYSGEYP